MTEANTLRDGAADSGAPRWRKRLVILLLALVAAAVVGRIVRADRAETESGAARRTPGAALVPTGEQREEHQAARKEKVDEILPYVTEGGIAMLLGLFAGMATRSFLKLGLFLAVAGFVALQYLAYKGILSVNWTAIKDFVLNIAPEGDWTTIVKQKLPSGGAFGLGYLLGLKRG